MHSYLKITSSSKKTKSKRKGRQNWKNFIQTLPKNIRSNICKYIYQKMQKNPRKKLPQTNKRDAPLPITNKEGGQKGTNERFEFEKKHKTYFQNSFEGPNQYWKASWEVVSMLAWVLASARRLVARRRTNRKQPKKRISSSFFLQKLRFDHTFISHMSFGNESPRPETHKSKTHRVAGFGSKEDSVLLACPKPWLPFSQHGHLMGFDGKVEFFAIFFISSFRGNASRTCFVPDMLICSLRTFWYVYFNGLSLNKKVFCSGALKIWTWSYCLNEKSLPAAPPGRLIRDLRSRYREVFPSFSSFWEKKKNIHSLEGRG